MTNGRSTLRNFVTGLPEILDRHLDELADDVAVADAFIPVHMEAIELLRIHVPNDETNDFGLVLLTAHSLNLYTTMLELALRGRFDVAWHLSRAVFDSRSLAYAVARHAKYATRFLEDDLKASEARIFMLDDLGNTGYDDITPGIDERWRRMAKASNDLSHVNVSHFGALASGDATAVTPHLGGHSDARSCRLLFASAHENELWFLTSLEHLRKDALGDAWSREFLSAKVAFGEYWRGHKHEWDGSSATVSAR